MVLVECRCREVVNRQRRQQTDENEDIHNDLTRI